MPPTEADLTAEEGQVKAAISGVSDRLSQKLDALTEKIAELEGEIVNPTDFQPHIDALAADVEQLNAIGADATQPATGGATPTPPAQTTQPV